MEIPISKLILNDYNPNEMEKDTFEALKKSITSGDYDPILVSPSYTYHGEDDGLSSFVIVDGEFRYRAVKEIGLQTIHCNIKKVTKSEARIMNYSRNKERGSLNPIKEAKFFKTDLNNGLTQEQVSEKYHLTRSYVSSRLSLLKLDEQVVEIYTAPGPALKKQIIQEYDERKKQFDEMIKETPENELNISRNYKPDEPTEEDFVPRGTLSTSHLEAISSLPKKVQVEVAQNVLTRGSSVRATEQQVTRIKDDIAKEQRFKEALEKAKRKKCPKCGSPPKGFGPYNEDAFSCSNSLGDSYCYENWDYMKTKKDLEAEKSPYEVKQKEERSERLKEARANPSYVRMKETPEELTLKINPWILNIIHSLTEIEDVSFTGTLNGEKITVDYQPAAKTRWGSTNNLSLSIHKGENRFYFHAEAKDYKKFDAKTRVNISSPSEEKRAEILQFFEKTVNTKNLPCMG